MAEERRIPKDGETWIMEAPDAPEVQVLRIQNGDVHFAHRGAAPQVLLLSRFCAWFRPKSP